MNAEFEEKVQFVAKILGCDWPAQYLTPDGFVLFATHLSDVVALYKATPENIETICTAKACFYPDDRVEAATDGIAVDYYHEDMSEFAHEIVENIGHIKT